MRVHKGKTVPDFRINREGWFSMVQVTVVQDIGYHIGSGIELNLEPRAPLRTRIKASQHKEMQGRNYNQS